MSETLPAEGKIHTEPWPQILGTTCGWIAVILWFPATSLPMMTFEHFGRKTQTGLLDGVEKLYQHGNTTLAVFIFTVSVLFPLLKGFSLVLEGFVPYQLQRRSGIGVTILNVFRLPFRIPAKYSLGELLVLAIALMALSGAYGIKTYLNLGFWIFLDMLALMIISTGLLKWASYLRKGDSHELSSH